MPAETITHDKESIRVYEFEGSTQVANAKTSNHAIFEHAAETSNFSPHDESVDEEEEEVETTEAVVAVAGE